MWKPSQLERWARIERCLLVSAGALLIGVPIARFALGYGDLLQFLLMPFGFWCFWQALYEDKLDEGIPPTAIETQFAFLWLWTRRLVVGTVGVVFLAAGVYGISNPMLGDWRGTFVGILLGIFSLWIAFYGGGRRAHAVDARQVFLKRKERYKWRI